MDEITALRIRLLEQGYSCIPNRDKRTFFPGWPDVELTPAEIESWQRRFRRDLATGLRLDNRLAVVDGDVNEEKAAAVVINAMCDAVPALEGSGVLERGGKGFKFALFCRTDQLFSRIHSRRWLPPGADPDAETACVEIFGGASHRQFGAFGPHTRHDNGEVTVEYRWNGPTPADVELSDLHVFTKAEFFAMTDAAEAAVLSLGWTPVKLSQAGENTAPVVYDLTDDMVFHCDDDCRRTLAVLVDLARHDWLDRLRCSASWLEGPSARRTDRCLIGRTPTGALTIWESSAGVTHMVKPIEIDMSEVAETLRRIKERCNA